MRVSVSLALLALVAASSATAAKPKPIKWVPDRSFAKVVAPSLEKTNKKMLVSEIVCLKPDLPANTGVTGGVPQDDCLVVAQIRAKPVCFEFLWSGEGSGTELPCKEVHLALKQDVKPGWIVHYHHTTRFLA